MRQIHEVYKKATNSYFFIHHLNYAFVILRAWVDTLCALCARYLTFACCLPVSAHGTPYPFYAIDWSMASLQSTSSFTYSHPFLMTANRFSLNIYSRYLHLLLRMGLWPHARQGSIDSSLSIIIGLQHHRPQKQLRGFKTLQRRTSRNILEKANHKPPSLPTIHPQQN